MLVQVCAHRPELALSNIRFILNRYFSHKGKATRVGGDPGITTSVLQKIQVTVDVQNILLENVY